MKNRDGLENNDNWTTPKWLYNKLDYDGGKFHLAKAIRDYAKKEWVPEERELIEPLYEYDPLYLKECLGHNSCRNLMFERIDNK